MIHGSYPRLRNLTLAVAPVAAESGAWKRPVSGRRYEVPGDRPWELRLLRSAQIFEKVGGIVPNDSSRWRLCRVVRVRRTNSANTTTALDSADAVPPAQRVQIHGTEPPVQQQGKSRPVRSCLSARQYTCDYRSDSAGQLRALPALNALHAAGPASALRTAAKAGTICGAAKVRHSHHRVGVRCRRATSHKGKCWRPS